MAKLTRVRQKMKKGHRAKKPRVQRPLDVAQPNNHAARSDARQLRFMGHVAAE